MQQAYGTWNSPLTPSMMSGDLRLNDVYWDSDGETLVWSERRGASTILVAKQGKDAMRDLVDSSYKIGGRVGYGGGEFTVHDGIVYFVGNGQLYRLPLAGGSPQAISPRFGGAASPKVSPDGEWLAFVHTVDDEDVLALIDTQGKLWAQKIASGNDFYMQPAWHPDNRHIAYVTWNHPNMPWNDTELRILTLKRAGNGIPYVAAEEIISSGKDVAIFQPEFSPDGRYLSYISDESGYGHLYLYDMETREHRQITDGAVEHIIPAWVQSLHTYAWTSDGAGIYYIRHENAVYSVWLYDLEHDTSIPIHELNEYSFFDRLSISVQDEQLALIASASTIPARVITYSTAEGVQVVRRATTESLTGDYLSPAIPLTWTGHDGEDAHGLYYAPKNPNYEGINKPPLMVLVHGGPTSQRPARYDGEVQFFTTRGYAVLQVNHRGSTGYGKAYMNKHKGNWGVYDVQDSITGAQYLVERGEADADKIVIMGGSAGGYTVLQALVDEPGFFKAGVCSYGIANQFSLVLDTHKFEARYSDWLLGALPEAADKWRDRSPLFHAHNISDALLVFQGADDNVVPQNQSDVIVQAVRRNGVPNEYIIYEGEGHGFRRPETIADFYQKIIKFLTEYVIYG